MTRFVSQIMEIPVPKEPKTKLVFGELHSGSSFNTSPRKGFLRFEVTSEGDEVIEEMEGKIKELCEQYSLESDTNVDLEVVAKRQNCGIPFTHPLVKTTRSIMAESGITPKVDPSTGDLNALIRAGHPGVTGADNRGKLTRRQRNHSFGTALCGNGPTDHPASGD